MYNDILYIYINANNIIMESGHVRAYHQALM